MVGQEVSAPFVLAPVGLLGMQHGNGEILSAQAANEAGIPFTLSTMSICSIEDVAEATRKPFWFQLYVIKDRGFSKDLLGRAVAVFAILEHQPGRLTDLERQLGRNDPIGPAANAVGAEITTNHAMPLDAYFTVSSPVWLVYWRAATPPCAVA